MRLTRSEAAFVLGISVRTLQDKLQKMNFAVGRRGLALNGEILSALGIDQRRIDEASARARSINLEHVQRWCKTCQSLGRLCREHEGIPHLQTIGMEAHV